MLVLIVRGHCFLVLGHIDIARPWDYFVIINDLMTSLFKNSRRLQIGSDPVIVLSNYTIASGRIQGRGSLGGSLGGRGVSVVDLLVDLVVIDVQDGDLNRFRNLTSTIFKMW